jgi:hypothetical protein
MRCALRALVTPAIAACLFAPSVAAQESLHHSPWGKLCRLVPEQAGKEICATMRDALTKSGAPARRWS